jgi:hypothetical protein
MTRAVIVLAYVSALARIASAEDRARAESYFRAGEKAYQAQNFAAAAQDFDIAYDALALPEIAFSAAQAYRKQYRIEPKPEYVKRAVELYRAYLDKVKTGGRVGDATDALAEMQRELDKIVAAGMKVTAAPAAVQTKLGVSVTFGADAAHRSGPLREVEDALGDSSTKFTATIDGKPVAPFTLVNVEPGKHVIHVEADGYFPVDRPEVLGAGTMFMAEATLEPKPARIDLTTEPGARIIVDGRFVGTAPLASLDVAAGKHLLAITHRGRTPIVRELVVTRGQTLELDHPLKMTFRRRLVPWFGGAAAVFGATALVGATVGFFEDRHVSDLLVQIRQVGDQPTSVLDDYEQTRVRRNDALTAMWINLGVGAALAGVATILYYTDEPSSEGVRVMVTPSGAGAAVSGRF